MSELQLTSGDIDVLKGQALQERLPAEVLVRLDWFAAYARGKTASEICREYGIARTTFYRWLERLDPRNLRSLVNEPRTPPRHLRLSFRRPARYPQSPASVSKQPRTRCCVFCRLADALRPFMRTAFLVALLSILGNLLFILFILFPTHAQASAWNPTLLVNTEAFMVIDDVDMDADPSVVFGSGLGKTLLYNRSLGQFEINDDLEVAGTLSGTSLTVSGLKNCNTIDTDGNGHFICGTDEGGLGSGMQQADGDKRFVRKQGDTMTGALIIRPTAGASSSGLSVMAIMSGYKLRVSGPTDIHGLLVASGAIRTETGIVIASDNPAQDAILTFGNNTAAQTIKFLNGNQVFRFSKGIDVVGTISGSLITQNGAGNNYFMGSVGVGTTTPDTSLDISSNTTPTLRLSNEGHSELWGTGEEVAGIEVYSSDSSFSLPGVAAKIAAVQDSGISGARVGMSFHVFNETSLNEAFRLASSGNVGIGSSVPETKLEVVGTISGSRLALTGDDTVTSTGALYVFQKAFATGAMIRNAQTNRPVLALDSQGTNGRSAHLMFGYKGTFDTNLFRKAANALRTDGSFEVMGTLSGSSLFGAGLGDCNNATNSKLIYNASTGKFSCATDQTGGVGSGLSFATAEGIFVNQGGDTMTGALTIQNGNAHISTTDPMLNVRGAISGSLLRAGNMTVSGAVVYSSGNTLKQTAKGLSGQLLISQGTSAPAWRTPVGGMVWYFNGTQTVGSGLGAQVTMPFAISLTSVIMTVKGAPSGADLIIDIKQGGSSIFSTKPQINAGAYSGGGNAAFSTTVLPEDALITLDVNQVGSTFAGSGLTVMLKGIRRY